MKRLREDVPAKTAHSLIVLPAQSGDQYFSDSCFSTKHQGRRRRTAALGQTTSDMFRSHYADVCRAARSHLSREWSHQDIESSSLATEAYLRMDKGAPVKWDSTRRFFGALHISMKRILIEMGRSRRAQKREGLHRRVDLEDVTLYERDPTFDRLELNSALERIKSPRQREVLLLRFIEGMNIRETAEAMNISESTVKKVSQKAKAALTKLLTPAVAAVRFR
jgi:RNA polymerase sigma factor (TIGR02999 family)